MRRCERKRQKRRTCQLSEEGEDKQIVAHSLLFIQLHHGEGSLFLKPVICHFLSNLFLHCAIFHYVWADASVCYQALKNPRIFWNSVGAQTSCLVHKDRVRHEKKLYPHSHTRTCSLQKKNNNPQTHAFTHCQSNSFASADSHQEIPAAVFPSFPSPRVRLISHSTLYLSHLSAFVLVSFIISLLSPHLLLGKAQCEVWKSLILLWDMAYLRKLTYCLIEWQIKWK